ncbi:MAG: helix-turn-helix domain-containing protein [Oscillibacter sp.]
MDYISVKEAAERWNVSDRRVHQYCKDERIPGLLRFGRAWMIPAAAEKPADPRCGKKMGGDGNGAR